MQGYAQEIFRTRFFVGLRIEMDAPGVLAAIRPWAPQYGDPALIKWITFSWVQGYSPCVLYPYHPFVLIACIELNKPFYSFIHSLFRAEPSKARFSPCRHTSCQQSLFHYLPFSQFQTHSYFPNNLIHLALSTFST